MGRCQDSQSTVVTMFSSDPFQIWWFKAGAYAIFAAFGGMMGYLLRAIDGGHSVTWWRAAIEGLSAGFVGLLVLFACQAMHLDEPWVGVIVGVSGWLGANSTIHWLEVVAQRKLGIQEKPNDKP